MILMIREFEAAPSSGTSSQMQSNALDDKTLESIRRPGNDYVPSLQTLRPFIEVVTHDPTLIDGRVNLRVNERDTVYAGGMMNNDGARRVDWGAEHKMDNGMTIGGGFSVEHKRHDFTGLDERIGKVGVGIRWR